MLGHMFHHHHRRHDAHFGRHHRGFQGFAGFGGGPGQMFGGDRGRGGIGAGRKLASGDLQLLVLSLLAEKPHHGYEIIRSIGDRSGGYYSPSPGMVYPALTYLEEIGHATVEIEGTRKRYAITPEGVAHLEANRANADTLLEQLAWIGQRMGQVREAFGEGAPRDPGEDFDAPLPEGRGRGGLRGRRVHRHGDDDFLTAIRLARRNLKAALVAKAGASEAEQARIAAILERAAGEIRGG